MKRVMIFLLGIAMTVAVAVPAFADGVIVQYTSGVGQSEIFYPEVVIGSDGIGRISQFSAKTGDGSIFRIDNLVLDSDPVINFSVGASNFTDSPLSFSFGFNTPIALGGADKLIDASSSITYTLTDGYPNSGGEPGVTLTPLGGSNTLVANDFDTASNWTNKGVDVGPNASGAGTFGPFTATNTFAGGPFTLMNVTLSFTLSPHDSAGLTGSVTQEERGVAPVPEPATMLLLGSGLIGLAGYGRKKFFKK